VVRRVSRVIHRLRGRPTCGELREGTLGALQLIVFAIPERFWGKSLFDVRKHSSTFQIVALPREVRSDRERNAITESDLKRTRSDQSAGRLHADESRKTVL
jgi:hypothetical protein